MPGFLRSSAFWRKVAAAGGDAVPDGPAVFPVPAWSLVGLTRAEGGAELNPPLVTLTEAAVASGHYTYINVAGGSGPVLRTRTYLRAGTRRYVSIVPGMSPYYAVFVVDTVGWTITQQSVDASGLAVIISASLSNLGGGDYLLETVCAFNDLTSAEIPLVQGAAAATGVDWGSSYTGTGATVIVRRLDSDTMILPLTLGAGTITKAATTGTALTGATTHTPAAGVTACVVRYICRTTVTQAYVAPTATFQGQPVVFPANSQAGAGNAIGRCLVGVGIVYGLTPSSAGSLIVSNPRVMGQLVARIDDISGLIRGAGGVGVANSSAYGSTAKNSHNIAAVTQRAGSILLGIVGGTSGSIDPLTQDAGWTEQGEDVTGTNATTDVAATFINKTGGALGATETAGATATAGQTSLNWGAAIVELKT